MLRRPPPHAAVVALFTFWVWVLLTWTLTAEFLIVGAVLSIAVTVATLPIYAGTGRVRITPRRVWLVLRLAGRTLPGVIVANLSLARRIWSPHMPLRTGMVVVPTKARTDAGLTAVGVVTSLIVDNQIVDIDRSRNRLLYHAVVVPDGDSRAAYDAVNGPIDAAVAEIERVAGHA
jgi:multicomponent Na+:H+ antiporter subunit E